MNRELQKQIQAMVATRNLTPQQTARPGGAESIPGIDPYWFSALQPTKPVAPQQYRPRQWPFIPGFNKIWEPRGEDYARIPFDLLYRAAYEWDLFDCAMETVIDKITSLDWQVRPKGEENKNGPDSKDTGSDPTIAKLTKIFNNPCRTAGMDTWRGFANRLLTDMYIGDCATIYLRQNLLGQIVELVPIAGWSIKVLIDDTGARPNTIDAATGKKAAAFQQVAYGLPAIDFTEDDVIYAVRKPTNSTAYGRSHLEQILTYANIGIRSQQYLLAYYSEGNTPEMLIPVDANTPASKVEEWNTQLDGYLAGQLGERRKIKMIPAMNSDGKLQVIFPKEPLLKSDVDEWLARIICFCLGLNPQAFVKSMNRATSEQAQDTAEAEGQQPVINWFEDVMNEIIRRLGYGDDYEFSFRVRREQDGLKQMQIDVGYLKSGVMSVNDVLRDLGMDEINEAWADKHYVETPQGAVPFDSVDETAEANLDKLKNPPAPPKPGDATPSHSDEEVAATAKAIADTLNLIKSHRPESRDAANRIEATLMRKLSQLHTAVRNKVKQVA